VPEDTIINHNATTDEKINSTANITEINSSEETEVGLEVLDELVKNIT
jgi:hypothetical protein